MRVCAKFGIATEVFEDPLYTGVWVKGTNRKICALGVNASDGVTTHGIALNVNTDLSWFGKVVPEWSQFAWIILNWYHLMINFFTDAMMS